MDIRNLPAYNAAPVTNMVRPARIPAPDHPLADRDGLVPVEVFDLPPELLSAIRALPIRGIGSDSHAEGMGARPTPPARLRPLDAPTFQLDL